MAKYPHFILFRDDAGMWCAAPPTFRDLMFDPTGWGETRVDAISDLLRDREFLWGVKRGEWVFPTLADFVEVPEPDGAKILQISYVPVHRNFDAALRRQSFKVIAGG